jgi:hypothetical protein
LYFLHYMLQIDFLQLIFPILYCHHRSNFLDYICLLQLSKHLEHLLQILLPLLQ